MKRILVIDDSLAIRKAIRRILEPMGYDVGEAGDGAEGLSALAEAPLPDAILCDVDMPVMDGLAFLGALRDGGRTDLPPVIMCTTHASFEKISAALSLGASEYIMKPFDSDIIGSKLEAVGVQ